MARQLSAANYQLVVELRRMGLAQKVIARRLRITQGAVSKILHRFRNHGSPSPRPRSGRPRVSTARDDRALLRLARENRMRTANWMRNQWMPTLRRPLSRRTVNRRLTTSGLYARRPVKKPILQPRHVANRLAFARRHQRRPPQQWARVVFSEEARFEVYRLDGRVRCRRRKEELYHEACIMPKVHSGGGGVTVWAAFHATGKTDLCVIQGNLNQAGYLAILQERLLPFARAAFQDAFVFQDDNAPCHRARAVQDFLEREDINHLEWPAVSPDMNPIENLWAELSRRLMLRIDQPTTVAELTAALHEEWAAIPAELLRTLAERMPQRIAALLQAGGGHTRY